MAFTISNPNVSRPKVRQPDAISEDWAATYGQGRKSPFMKQSRRHILKSKLRRIGRIGLVSMIGSTAYSAGEKIRDYIKGLGEYQQESEDWTRQSISQGNRILNLLRQRRRKMR